MKRPVKLAALRPLLLALALLTVLAMPSSALAQAPVPPPDMVDWNVDRTPSGFNAYWELSPQVRVYLNLYRRSDGVNVASQDLGTGILRGNGVYRYSTSLSTPTVKPDEEYTLDVVAEDLNNPALTWRFGFIILKDGESTGGIFSGVTGWLRDIRDALNPLNWVSLLFSFGVATVGNGVNQFLCDTFSWTSGQTPTTCVP